MKMLRLMTLIFILSACSSTQYESAALMSEIEVSELNSVKLHVATQDIVIASQANERLFKLHHNHAEVHEMIENIASRFGFQLSSLANAEYRLDVSSARPDGGKCLEGFSSFNKGMTFTFSVLTLGVLPATNGYCLEVNASLSYRQELYGELSSEMSLLADFQSNAGRVSVLAGANEVDNYQRTVTIEDEAKALETSITHLFLDMIKQGAFE
ncbi:MAG: hypothetical protein ACMZ64_01990 [Oleiphilus sp.]